MSEIPRRDEIRELIVEALVTTKIRDPFKVGLRWSEIRNSIINQMSLKLNADELNGLGVRLDRALKDNIKYNFIIRECDDHKNVRYKLSEIEFPKYHDSKTIQFNVELPPVFGLYGLLKDCTNFNEFKNSLQKYIMTSVEDRLVELWKQYEILSKYSFEDWGKVSDILESNDYTIDEKKEVIEFSNLMFKWMLYRREKLILPTQKKIDKINKANHAVPLSF